MPSWLEHLLVLTLVAFCGAALVWQMICSLRGTGKMGRCCATGCDASTRESHATGNRVVFFPSDSLRRR